MNDEIEKLREKINELNSEIVNLLDERISVAKEIGRVKKSQNLPVFDASRELKVLEEVSSLSKHPENMKEIFQKIIDETKKIEHSL